MERWWVQAYPDESYRAEVFAQWMGLVGKAIAEKSEIERREYRTTCKDGTVKITLIFGIPVSDKVFVMFDDITERKRAEEERLQLEQQFLQAQKLESLGIMAGGIAHDFNNLLQSILGNMELAARTLPQNADPYKYITRALNSGQAAAHLTSLMLAYVGKGSLAKKDLDLNELVRVNADMLKTTVGSAVSLDLSLSEESPRIVADEAQIQQVIMNLLTNAAESIEEQPGVVRLTTGSQQCDQVCLAASLLDKKPEPGCYVFLEVSDTGCGMSAETMKRLFDPFFTTKFTGRGLGMSAVMGIMQTHNGALFIRSEPGTGTTFRVCFPASEAAPSPTALSERIPPAENGMVAEKPLSGVVLVVDDEKSVLRTSKKMVELCGFTVITARDGVEAVSLFREHARDIDIVLLDLTMPNMDGIAAMNEIYRIRPDVKLLLSSGFNKNELSGRITGQAPSGFIRKPFSLTELETELRRAMLAE
jgi:signal transduction histidine kinase/CheY-like chemotaxis protein